MLVLSRMLQERIIIDPDAGLLADLERLVQRLESGVLASPHAAVELRRLISGTPKSRIAVSLAGIQTSRKARIGIVAHPSVKVMREELLSPAERAIPT